MTLADYLQTPQAREDVRHILSCGVPSAQWFPATKTRISESVLGAWIRILITAERHSISACYRPDGDRYVVTDLGEGVRALRLRTGRDTPTIYHLPPGTLGQGVGFGGDGCVSAAYSIPSADLPDAICRVMLASLRVAQS